jgi:hypothetical protein
MLATVLIHCIYLFPQFHEYRAPRQTRLHFAGRDITLA